MLSEKNYSTLFYKEQIGAGSFGQIFLAETDFGELVAVKKEWISCEKYQLQNEINVYKELNGGIGFPEMKYSGQQGKYNILVMDYLGKSLQQLFEMQQFNFKTVIMIANQLLCRIEFLHRHNYIHRDIKPDNFLIGRSNHGTIIYMIDFGLAKMYRDPKTGTHIPMVNGKSLTGTTRFASLNNHRGMECSRRDDLESLAYMLIYFIKGKLPWQGIEASSREKWNEKVYHKKVATPLKELCSNMPIEFSYFLSSVRNLGFEEEPKYADYRKMFNELLLKYDQYYDGLFCWVTIRCSSSVQEKKKKTQNSSYVNSAYPFSPKHLKLPRLSNIGRVSVLKGSAPRIVAPKLNNRLSFF